MEHETVGRRARRFTALIGVIFVLFTAICGMLTGMEQRGTQAATAAHPVKMHSGGELVIVLDPGHGGPDGGASAPDGRRESDINLEIAGRIEALLQLFGVRVVMTRSEDISLHSEDALTLRQKKTSDLQNRVSMLNAFPEAFLVSIHQNCFSAAQYSGAQVFFSANDPLGGEMAVYIQENLRLALDPENQRQAAVISDSVYLMKHKAHSGILVECGFLSNREEAQRLQRPDYQLDIAKAIAAGLLTGIDI